MCCLAEAHTNREKEIHEGKGFAKARKTSRSSSATDSATSDHLQQLPSYPVSEETAEVVDTVFETVEKSRRSTTFEGTAVGDEIDPTEHTQFELEAGSVVYVTSERKPLGRRAK